MRSPLLRRPLLCLSLGLATTLAISWLLAAFVPLPMYPRPTLGAFMRWDRPWSTAALRRPGITDLWWDDLQHDQPDIPIPVLLAKTQSETAALIATRPGSSQDNTPPTWGTFARPEPPPAVIGSDTAFGWPLRCLYYQVLGQTHRGPQSIILDHETLHAGLLLYGELSARGRDFRALPLHPIPLNLAANALLFTLLWATALYAPRALRTHLRRARHQCPHCGYSRESLTPDTPCPECGQAPIAH